MCRCLYIEMRHVCDACGRSYSRAANLNRHKAEVHNNDSERRRHMCSRCGRNFVSGGRLVNHVCREQVGPQPRILVRDRDYDDTTLDPPPTDPSELNEIYTTNWPSIRSSRYNRRYQDILNCRLLRVISKGMEQPGLCSENQCKLWCVTPSCNLGEVKVLSCLLKQCNCVPGGLNNIQSCRL